MSQNLASPTEVIVIDAAVSDWKTLVAGLSPDIPVILLPAGGDGIASLAAALAGYGELSALHLVSHGGTAYLQLGDSRFGTAALAAHGDELAAIAAHLTPGADVLLYGCSVAAGETGASFVADLSAALGGADVAASTDRTGPLALGGDWDLEFADGEIETVLPFTVQGMQGIDQCLGCTTWGPPTYTNNNCGGGGGGGGDSTAPNAPSTPNMTAATDGGPSNTDDITNDTTPTFIGTAEANSTVKLYDGSTQIGSAIANGSGNWLITASTLSEGNHSIKATATDSSNNISGYSSSLSITIDSTVSTVSSVSANTSNGTYKTGDTVAVTVQFSETITVTGTPTLTLNSGGAASYASGSGTNTLIFNYTIQAGESAADLDYSATNALALSGGTIMDSAGNNATLTLPTVGGGSSLGGQKNIVIDGVAPSISSSSVPANATYVTGNHLDFAVTFSEAVTVNTDGGTPYVSLTLDTGGSVQAAYLSGSGTNNLTFRHTVSAGSVDANGVTVANSITLSGGTVKDGAGNNAATSGINFASTASVLVEAVAPTVSTINRVSSSTTNATSVDYTVTFSENVSGVDTSDFTLTATGTASGSVASVAQVNASTYTVTVNSISGNGTIRLDLKNSGTGISDTPGNAITAGFTSGQTYTIDNTAPQVTSVGVPASATYGTGQNLDFTVNFGEAVTVNTGSGTPYIPVTLDTGGTVQAAYVSGSGSSALVFRYTVVSGNLDSNGIVVGGSINASGGTLRDTVGNDATLTLNSVGATAGVLVSTAVAPSVTGLPATLAFTEDTPASLDLSASNFSDSDSASITVTLATSAGGTFSLAAPGGIAVTLGGNATSSITLTGAATDVNAYLDIPSNIVYNPPANLSGNGADSISVKANDGSGDVNLGLVALNIAAVNDAPIGISLSTSTLSAFDSDGATVGTLTSTDLDTSDTHSYSIVSVTNPSSVDVTASNLFAISGSTLTAATPSTLNAGNYTLVVRTTDSGTGNLTYDKTLTVAVSNALIVTVNSDDGVDTGDTDSSADTTYAQALADGGGLSLREALSFASTGNKTVGFAVGLNNQTITLGSDASVAAETTISLANGTALTITGNKLALGGALAIDNASGNDLNIASALQGAGGLTKTGAGKLTLASSNNSSSFSGGITVSAGTLSIASDAKLGTGSVTLNGGTLNLDNAGNIDNAVVLAANNGTVSVTNGGGTLSGNISGTGNLAKTGGQSLSLSGTNSYSGTTTIANTLIIGGDANIGAGAITLNAGATLQVTGGGTIDNAVTLNGDGTIQTDAATSLSGAINGSGALTKTGGSALTLSGDSTYTGTTNLSTGVLIVTHSNALGTAAGGTTVASGTTLRLGNGVTIADALTLSGTGVMADFGALKVNEGTGSATVAGNITLAANTSIGAYNAGDTLNLSGVVSGGHALTKVGAGMVVLSGSNTYSGATTVSSGTLSLSGGAALSDIGDVIVNGTLALSASETIGALSGSGVVTLGSNTLTLNRSANTTFSGAIGGTGGLTKNSGGTLELTGNNTYSGATVVSAGGLTLNRSGGALADSSAVTVGAGATLTLSQADTIGSLAGAGAVVLGSNQVTVGGDNSSTTFSGILSGTSGSLSKAGSGTFTLTGTNTYTGATTVSAGTLAGTGSLAGALNLDGRNGVTATLAPGVSGAGVFTLGGGLTHAEGGILAMDIHGATAGSGYDQIAVTGAVDLTDVFGTGATTLTLDFGSFTPTIGDSFTLINNDATDAITGTVKLNGTTELADNATFTAAGKTFRIDYDGGDGNDLALTVINQQPALTDTNIALPSLAQGAGIPSGAVGTLVSALIGNSNASDPDSDPLGMAVTGVNANGALWFSINGGTTWTQLTGTVNDASALMLHADANTRVYFQPAASYSGSLSDAITFRAWDRTGGIANGTAGQVVMAQPTGSGTLATDGDAYGIAVTGNYAYVAAREAGLEVVNISNPASPTKVVTLDTTGKTSHVVLCGNYAYIVDGTDTPSTGGLKVVDISNPASPTQVGWKGSPLGAPYRVALSGNYAYVAEDVAGVEIIDVSNPANLSRVTYYNSPGVAYGVDVVGNYLYVADKSAGLQIVDISTPASPTLVGTYDTAGAAYRVKVVGNYAYIADWTNGLVIVDVSTPASPTLKGSYDTSDNASDVAVVGNYAYVSDQAGGVQIIDISDPAYPSLLTGYDTSGTARSVAVAGSKAYVADTAGGLQVLDWSGMANFASMKSDTVALTVNAAPSDPAPTVKDDGDNIPATTEEKVPTLPATSGGTTVAGDGNGDGVADSAQANVTSVPFLKTDTAESAPGDAPPVYVTLVSDSVDGKTDTTQTQTAVLKDIQQLDAPADKPADVDMPLGLISFTADVASAGAQEDFSLYIDSGVLINGYWKQNTTGSWVNLASADYGGRVVSEGGKTRLDFQIVDGGEFDDDGKADGVITDPGAPGWRTVAGSDADNDQFPDALEATYGLTVGSKDNDVFASTKFFVLQLYRDFLFREAETDGLNYWMGQIDAGQLTRTEVASLFLDSLEFQTGAGPLARFYLGAFDRQPDAAGMDYWMAVRQDGMSLADIAAGFAGSAEFQDRYGALNDAALVAQLYQNLLGRAPEASGAAYWQAQQAAGLSTGDLVLDFTESAEYVARSDRDVTVTLDYVGLLGRTPEQGGFDYWLDRLDNGMPEIAVIGAFMGATEYHDRFLP